MAGRLVRRKEMQMNRPEYEALCHGVETGSERYVIDMLTRHVGKVLACEGNHFTVETGDHHESWPRQSCREKWGQRP
jgi:hypothetical protein